MSKKPRIVENPADANWKCRNCGVFVQFNAPANNLAALPPKLGECPACKKPASLIRYDSMHPELDDRELHVSCASDIPAMIQFYKANGKWGFLSNLYKVRVIIDGREFPTAEHAFQFAKFSDQKAAEWAMQAPSVHLVAVLAHGLFAWDIVENWASIKIDRMRQVLRAKFSQNGNLKQRLLETGSALLIEDSKTDAFWGLGKKGTGKNMLGKLLLETRNWLRCGLSPIKPVGFPYQIKINNILADGSELKTKDDARSDFERFEDHRMMIPDPDGYDDPEIDHDEASE